VSLAIVLGETYEAETFCQMDGAALGPHMLRIVKHRMIATSASVPNSEALLCV
jgi:hypothetical protein